MSQNMQEVACKASDVSEVTSVLPCLWKKMVECESNLHALGKLEENGSTRRDAGTPNKITWSRFKMILLKSCDRAPTCSRVRG